MSEIINEKKNELTGRLYMNLKRSETAYNDYLKGGKTYMFARILKIYNEKTRELLLEKGHLLDDNLQKDALLLISHCDIWLQKWNDLEKRLNPGPDDEFIFPNEFIFPKEGGKKFRSGIFPGKATYPGCGIE
jgi:hypothetical protein